MLESRKKKSTSDLIVEAVVFGPFHKSYLFLYHTTETNGEAPVIGSRLWVPFGTGFRMALATRVNVSLAPKGIVLKPIRQVLDDESLISEQMLALAEWAANYYHHPVGEVYRVLFPPLLRRKKEPVKLTPKKEWVLTKEGATAYFSSLFRGERQKEILQVLAKEKRISAQDQKRFDFDWKSAVNRMVDRGWVEVRESISDLPDSGVATVSSGIILREEQVVAAQKIMQSVGSFETIVLDGVTGSGKTEVYIHAIENILRRGEQALILVPEIALTTQLIDRFKRRFGSAVGLLHSGLGERERVTNWWGCVRGKLKVLIGARSAIWVPMPHLALIIVDEEHDSSYKQGEGFKYSGRDVAIYRAKQLGVPVVLGSATPGLDTLQNINKGKFQTVRLKDRPGEAALPTVECSDIRGLPLKGGLAPKTIERIKRTLEDGGQVLLFLNRRGYAPVLICRNCGAPKQCRFCDSYLVFHKKSRLAQCHHCGSKMPVPSAGCCSKTDVVPIGLGTEQLEEVVKQLFSKFKTVRIDRDTMRNQTTLSAALQGITDREYRIVVGTQMITKGLDFSGITLVVVVDSDGQLYSIDFRAEERLAQLLVQVAGRAGRSQSPGSVIVQTYQPANPVLQRVLQSGYHDYAYSALSERRDADLPPFTAMAIVRAESRNSDSPMLFLGELRKQMEKANQPHRPNSVVSSPLPAFMRRRAGLFRGLLVIRGPSRKALGELLAQVTQTGIALAKNHRVRWTIDVDPENTL